MLYILCQERGGGVLFYLLYYRLSRSMGKGHSWGSLAGNFKRSSAGGRAGHNLLFGADGWQYLVSNWLGLVMRGMNCSGMSCSGMWLRAILANDMPIVLLFMANARIKTKMRAMSIRLTRPTISIDLSIVNFGAKWGRTIWLMEEVIGVNFEESLRSGRLFSSMVALNWEEKLKCDVMLTCFKE